jgi:deoxyribonuclease-4
VDFGHLNAREGGAKFKTSDDYSKIFESIGEHLGDDAARYLHCHFSKIEYTLRGGERKHLTFEDKTFGPDFEPFAEALVKNKLYPNIICESDGTMDVDAIFMKKIYNRDL